MHRFPRIGFVLVGALCAPSPARAEPTGCPLAKDGKPIQRVIVGERASDRMRAVA